jgi:hypothetical protein
MKIELSYLIIIGMVSRMSRNLRFKLICPRAMVVWQNEYDLAIEGLLKLVNRN